MLYDYKDKYLIVFSSNYHGYYIEELLRRNEVYSTLRKAPNSIGKSCYMAIYIKEQDFNKAINLIRKTQIKHRGIYEIVRKDHTIEYKKLEIKKE